MYSITSDEGGNIASIVLGYRKKGISQPRQIEARRKAGMADDAAILCVSYIGKMSPKAYATLL